MNTQNKMQRWGIVLGLVACLVLFGCEGDEGDDITIIQEGGEGGPSILADWQSSQHAAEDEEPFRHWDEDGEIPTSCAKCHSTEGFNSFVMDGVVEEPADTEGSISCGACHASTIYDWQTGQFDATVNSATLEPVTFPSGETATLNGPANLCMACHQGRESGVDVQETITANPAGPFRFINIHYYPAAATLFGSQVNGGYEYGGLEGETAREYAGRFTHVPTRDTCVECHMGPTPAQGHTFDPQPEYCTDCHDLDTAAEEPFRDIRLTSTTDFDGDGDAEEGLFFEIETLADALLAEIQTYAETTIGTAIVYENDYPYFFADTDGDGEGDSNFTSFDATLLKAAYNYQTTQKEPCGYIHNARYVMQLIYDSIEDLGGDVSAFMRPADVGATGVVGEWRQSGHADVTAEAFNHWNDPVEDPDGIPTTCAKCHSAEGYRDYADDGVVGDPVPVVLNEEGTQVTEESTLTCGTCHLFEGQIAVSGNPTTLWESMEFAAIEPVTFPSGATQTLNGPSNMCMACHQGRESGVSVAEALEAADSHSFINRHYFAAAAIYFGSEVTAAYEYPGQTYAGQVAFASHPADLQVCVGCHMREGEANHTFEPDITRCDDCHAGIASFEEIGMNVGQDFDGDGTVEGFQAEIDAYLDALLSAMQDYADADATLPSIIYAPGSYPYFFIDTDGDRVLDDGEANFANRYPGFDDALLAAAFNFHSGQDPCNDIHNHNYAIQTLYDSIDDLDDGALNGSVTINGNAALRPGATNGGGGGPTTLVFENGVGNITFEHAAHVTRESGNCATCHGDPFQGLNVDDSGQANAHGFCDDCHTQIADSQCGFCHGN